MATAITQDLTRSLGAHITVITGRENAGIAPLMPGVSDSAAVDFRKPLAALAEVRRCRFDAVVDCAPWPRVSAIIASLSSSPFTLGFRTAGQSRHYAYGVAVTHRSDRHELENHRDLVRAFGVEPAAPPSLVVPSTPLGFPELPDRFVVCHLWAGGYRAELREWPLERWREVIRFLIAQGCSVVFTGGPADREASDDFRRSFGREERIVSLAGRTTLSELATVLSRSQLVLSVNTGAMHMAAAVGVPTVGLHGPTSPMRWGPVGPRAVAVSSRFDGCSFLNLGWEYQGQRCDCMKGLTCEDVLAAAMSVAPSLLGDAAKTA